MLTMTIEYAQEKFRAGIETLAEGRGDVRDRLHDAWASQIIRIHTRDDLPAEVRPRFEELLGRLTRDRSRPDGALKATIDAMSEEDVLGAIGETLSLAWEIEDWMPQRRG